MLLKCLGFLGFFWLTSQLTFGQERDCIDIEIQKCEKKLELKEFYVSIFDESLKRFGLNSQCFETDSLIRIWWVDFQDTSHPAIAELHLIQIKVNQNEFVTKQYIMSWTNISSEDSIRLEVLSLKECRYTPIKSPTATLKELQFLKLNKIYLMPDYDRSNNTTGLDFKFVQYLYGYTQYTIDYSSRESIKKTKYQRDKSYIQLLSFLKKNFGIDPPKKIR